MSWNFAALVSSSWSLPNDELALKNELNRLASSWSSLDSWLKFWILLVVVGVSIELVVILVEYRHELRDFRRGVMHTPDKPSSWLLGFALLGAGLVAIGVAGEFFIHIEAGKVETEMRDATSSLVAIVNGKAEELRKNNLLLQSKVNQEHAALLELEAKVAPRRVSGDQAKKLCFMIHVTNGPTLGIWSSIGTTEADDFAEDIGRALAACGFGVTHKKSALISPVPNPFRIGFAPNRKHDADMINAAMLKAKIATKPIERVPVPDADKDPQALRLLVGGHCGCERAPVPPAR